MQLFVFDIDGTITDSVAAHHRSFEKAFLDVGITDVEKNWAGYTHHTDSWIFAEAFRRSVKREPSNSEKAAFAAAVDRNFSAELSVQPLTAIAGAVEFISHITGRADAALVFATGSYRQPAVRKLTGVGVPFSEDLLITADDFETREDIVSNAIGAARRRFGLAEFSRTISIGDGVWDCLAARALAIEFVGIGAGIHAERLRTAGAVDVFDNYLAPQFWDRWMA